MQNSVRLGTVQDILYCTCIDPSNSDSMIRRRTKPLYQHVRDDILEKISGGTLLPGIALPSERELANDYGVGISTIRAAVSQLVAADVLVRYQGKGTYVTSHDVDTDIYRFFHVVQENGSRPLPKSKLLDFERRRADFTTADVLNLSHTDPEIFQMRNLLYVNGQPQVASDISVPVTMFPGLSDAVIQSNLSTIYGMYQSRYGIMIVRTSEKLWAKIPPFNISELLNVPASEPLLSVYRVGYTFNGIAAEVRHSWIRTDICHYEFEIGNDVDRSRF